MNKDDVINIPDSIKMSELIDLPETHRETIKTGLPALDDILYTIFNNN